MQKRQGSIPEMAGQAPDGKHWQVQTGGIVLGQKTRIKLLQGSVKATLVGLLMNGLRSIKRALLPSNDSALSRTISRSNWRRQRLLILCYHGIAMG